MLTDLNQSADQRFTALANWDGDKQIVCAALDTNGKDSAWLVEAEGVDALCGALQRLQQKLHAQTATMLVNRQDGLKLNHIDQVDLLQVDTDYPMPLTDGSAIAKLLDGEKPMPYLTAGGLPEVGGTALAAFSPLEIMQLDAGANAATICQRATYLEQEVVLHLDASASFSDVVAACKAEQARGAFLGFPESRFLSAAEIADNPPVAGLNCEQVIFFDTSQCILDILLPFVSECARQSCGRCVYCREGTAQMRLFLSAMQNGKGKPEQPALLQSLAQQMKNQVICHVGRAAAMAVLSAFAGFGEELEEHITAKTCATLSCKNFYTFHILQDKCTGCGECADVCPEDAIAGKPRFIHVIDKDDCDKCDMCYNACKASAIVKAGRIKPPCPPRPIPVRKREN